MATLGERLVAKAKTAVGQPYVWGGTGPNGFDCSGLVTWAAQALGIKGLPRTSQEMRNAGKTIPLAQIGIGDLVTFNYTDRRGGNPAPANHVAIYAGQGQVVQASGSRVNVGPLDTKRIDRVIRLDGSGVVPAGDVSGGGLGDLVGAVTSVKRTFTAQHAGYAAEARTGPYGAPVNPFKMPGWIASAGSEQASTPGGVEQASAGGDLFGGGGSMPWDGVGTVMLASLFVLGGLVLVVVGGHVATRSTPEG